MDLLMWLVENEDDGAEVHIRIAGITRVAHGSKEDSDTNISVAVLAVKAALEKSKGKSPTDLYRCYICGIDNPSEDLDVFVYNSGFISDIETQTSFEVTI